MLSACCRRRWARLPLAAPVPATMSAAPPPPRPYKLWWSVDRSATIITPPAVIRGDRGLPLTRYNLGNNGNVTNVYGNKGNMPKYHGGVPQNGGIPQNGSLEVHLARYRISLNALIPEEDYQGVCMLDFEHWRADWNSSDWNERERAVAFAGNGNVLLARQQYEAATRRFMLATINETRLMRPGCLIGWYGYPHNPLPFIPPLTAFPSSPPLVARGRYGYPRNPLPFIGSTSRRNWCGWHSDGNNAQCGSWAPSYPGCLIGDACFFENNVDASTRWMRLGVGAGYHTAHGPYQRAINDELSWLVEASDVLIPSIYLGFQSDRYPVRRHRRFMPPQALLATTGASCRHPWRFGGESNAPYPCTCTPILTMSSFGSPWYPQEFDAGEINRLYVHGTVAEARRMADNAAAATGRPPPLVLPIAWARYNDYWDAASGPSSEARRMLPLDDARTELIGPRDAGADGVILWGNVQPDGQRHNASTMQRWVDEVLTVLVDELAPPTTTTATAVVNHEAHQMATIVGGATAVLPWLVTAVGGVAFLLQS